MNPTRRRFIGIAAAASALALAPYPARRAAASIAPTIWQGVALGADAELRLYHPDPQAAQRLIAQSLRELHRLEAIFSLYRDDSALSRLNRQGFLDNPPADLLRLLSVGLRYGRLTGGAFDPTVQPLWQLYAEHFSRPGADREGPAAPAVAQALARVSYEDVALDSDRIALRRPGMGITLNGIAQGYITDRITELLKLGGLERALVDMGEIQGMDTRAAPADWVVGLADPRDPARMLGTARLRNQALATSGGYGTAIDAEGRFTHLFDPHTGRARPLYRSVSVMAPNATMADALSTAFSYMPLDATELIVREHGLRAWFALSDGGLVMQDPAG
ncbi:FAD:protein FMN transferase [Achromobacter veterisilvae]|uniref:FAD:protein FMN transferase n=1 Tax=Achromobacter veterisilvae TaxID=2069367 RepID=A0A446CW76_9BURK|nr:FAD:protein FMN transferase [Achromobacter veterisilvae]SSW72089.1 FAD:protein FMN transferase [Achromobacter veterisilvae]